MRVFTLTAAIACLPAALTAQQDSTQQASGSGQSRSVAGVSARADARAEVAAIYTAEARAKLEASLRIARERGLPEEPIMDRIAEGQAKGASEAQIVLAASRMQARLEAVQSAMIRAGRTQPSDEEVEGGAEAIERGATRAQIDALLETAPADRSLVIAFDVLASLLADGRPVAGALAQIQANLESRSSDAALLALAGNATVGGSAGINGLGSSSAAGSVGGSVAGSAQGVLGGATSVGATVTGTVGGVIKP